MKAEAKIRTVNLTKRFEGLVAVNNVSFSLLGGEILGIIGPNGAGKSTFINLVSGVTMPSSGNIFFGEQEITWLSPHLRSRMGIARTFQIIHNLEDLTALENIMVGLIFSRKMSIREAKRNAAALAETLALENPEREVTQLSILEIKKMEIARALATGPSVLFLDELMAGLNADETHAIIATVKDIARKQNMAMGVVEHVMGVIRELTERVIVLDAGQLIAEGPYADVSKNPRVIQAYLGGAVSNA